MVLRNISESTLSLQCFDTLQELIVNGSLAPGQKLKIASLKSLLGVGQSPIREALSRLVGSGLVDVEDNKGFRVATIDEKNVRDVYTTFFDIESLALTKAMKYGDDLWETSIVAALHHLALIETKKEPVPYRTWADRNYAFHVALIAGCNSPLLLSLRHDVYMRFDRYCRLAYTALTTDHSPNHEEHQQLAAAVLARATDRALTIIERHILASAETIIKTLKLNGQL